MIKRTGPMSFLLSLVFLLILSACSADQGQQEVGNQAATNTSESSEVAGEPSTATPEPAGPSIAPEGESAPAEGVRTFTVVAEESTALYRVDEEFLGGAVERLGKALGFNEAVASTGALEGELTLSLGESGGVSLEGGRFTVDLRTLKSDDNRRDQRIREQWLESDRFPTAEFVITNIEGLPSSIVEGEVVTFILLGDMTIREITNQERFEVTATLEGDTITGTATTQIMMVDYGFDPPEIPGFLKAVDPATIEIEITARESS